MRTNAVGGDRVDVAAGRPATRGLVCITYYDRTCGTICNGMYTYVSRVCGYRVVLCDDGEKGGVRMEPSWMDDGR